MFYIGLHISNPFKTNTFKNLFNVGGRISKNKSWEFEIIYSPTILLEFNLRIVTSGVDHAGLELDIGMLGLSLNAKIYDNRHWDYDNNCWEKHDEKDRI